ncbi:MAG: MauE/DoxX family redox-associated membrane protein [Actinomycetales bacterium]
MHPLAGVCWAALALLVVAGAPKVLDPLDTARALRLAGLRIPLVVVRIFGGVEAGLGVVALVTGNRALLAVAALSYLGFAVFIAHALRSGTPVASCGCFAKADTPPTRTHLVIDLLFALALGAAAVTGGTGLLDSWNSAGAGVTVLTVGFAAMAAWFAYLAMAVLPTSLARPVTPESVRRTPASPGQSRATTQIPLSGRTSA